MAELTESPDDTATSTCCHPEQQADCCQPSEKADCCEPESSSCGCSVGQSEGEEIREAVRSRYAAAAESVTGEAGASCCGTGTVLSDEEAQVFGAGLYDEGERGELPDTATMASLGCGNPTAVAELGAGETVLDLGSGGGIDVLLSAKRVGPTGKAYGLDMTDEMLALARENQRKAGIENVEWLRGEIEAIPLLRTSPTRRASLLPRPRHRRNPHQERECGLQSQELRTGLTGRRSKSSSAASVWRQVDKLYEQRFGKP
jgi:hypothetical protein